MVDLFKDLKEPIIHNFQPILVVIGIPVTNRHSIPVESIVDLFLAFPLVEGTTPDMNI